MKEQNLDFEVARDFFIEMKHYTIQNYLIFFSKGIVYGHDITQHIHCVYAIVFFEKAFIISFFIVIKYAEFI